MGGISGAELKEGRERQTHEFFMDWLRTTATMSHEEKGAYADIAAFVINRRKRLTDEEAVNILRTTIRKWKRLKEALMLAGALNMDPEDGSVMVVALKDRIYRSGYRHIKAPISARLRWHVFQRDGYQCCKCGSKEDLTADHIDPEVNGGEAILSNLQTLCRPCNSGKGAR